MTESNVSPNRAGWSWLRSRMLKRADQPGLRSRRLSGSRSFRARRMSVSGRRGNAPGILSGNGFLGRSPVAAYAVRWPIRVARPGWARDRRSVGFRAPGRLRLTAGTSRSVIWWMKRLTKTGRLRQGLFTAATGRRAVEHLPQPGFHWRRGFALSVLTVTGHLPTPRRWGTGCQGEACP